MRVIKIGRSKENDIYINDSSVSREHASLIISGGRVSVRDNNSLNGTYVNGNRIRGEVTLNNQDFLKIGNQLIRWKDYLNEPQTEARTSYNDNSNQQSNNGVPNKYIQPNYQNRQKNNGVIIAIVIILFLCGLLTVFFFLKSSSPESKLKGKWDCTSQCYDLKELTLEIEDGDKKFKWKSDDNTIYKGTWKINDPSSSTKKITFKLKGEYNYNHVFTDNDSREAIFEYEINKSEMELTRIYDGETSNSTISLEKER